MKSKRANEFFADERVAFRTGGTYYVVEVDARKAVELAEEDARERAVKVFANFCPDNIRGECRENPRFPTPCQPGKCDACIQFLKHYDNE